MFCVGCGYCRNRFLTSTREFAFQVDCDNIIKGGDVMVEAVFKKKFFGKIVFLLCGLFLIGLFVFINLYTYRVVLR